MDPSQALKHKAEAEVMACIGCNDCMLACPLPETQLVTIAELNAGVHQSVITNPNVIEFVMACTQCRQCVPVCPADLSRADMVLFNKIKVEDVVPDRILNLQVGQSIVPSDWTLDALAQQLTNIPLFEGVEVRGLRRMLLKATLRQLGTGEVLCREGQYHERLYIVVDGAVEQTVSRTEREATRILVLGPGSFHGEMAVLANHPETFTVRALQTTLALEVPKTTLYGLMEQSATFQGTMTALYERRAIWTHARNSPLLASLPDDAVQNLLGRAELKVLAADEVICSEGQPVHDFFLVRSGFLRVSRRLGTYGDRVLVYFREGDTFGALALLTGVPEHTFSVRANTRAEVIRVPGQVLKEVLDKHPAARQRMVAEAIAAEKVVRSPELAPPGEILARKRENTTQMGLSWTGLIDKGIIQGHEVLVIDQNICTDCNNCVDACGRRHGYSRLERSGLQLGNLLFPTACRHCEDPVCLLCSVNGIVRQPDGEISIVTDNCIGCGACAERCPYDNIRMHPAEQPPEKLLLKLYNYFRGAPSTPKEVDPESPKVAVKCDLCAGYKDYACVTACPVGAAFRIDPVEAFGRNDLLIGLEMRQSARGNQSGE